MSTDVTVSDRLPHGFRYQSGSFRVGEEPVTDPVISDDGRTLTIDLGDLAPASVTTLRYVCEVGPGATVGDAVNLEIDTLARYVARLADAG